MCIVWMKMKVGMVLKEVIVGELMLVIGMFKIGVVLVGVIWEDFLCKVG